jgi:hypothetical protein
VIWTHPEYDVRGGLGAQLMKHVFSACKVEYAICSEITTVSSYDIEMHTWRGERSKLEAVRR